MNNYILLEGKKYKTTAKTWTPGFDQAMTARHTLLGRPDVTYGAGSWQTWQGEIMIGVTPPDATFGTVADFKAAMKLKRGLAFTDHYGDEYVIHSASWRQRSLTNKWDGPSNKLFFMVKLMGAEASQ